MKMPSLLAALFLVSAAAAADHPPPADSDPEMAVKAPPSAAAAPPAPDFEFRPHGGPAFRLSDLDGRVRVVEFWATWCGDCVRNKPAMRELLARFAGRGVQFLGVSKDRKKTPEQVAAAAREAGQHYPLMIDKVEAPGRVTDLYQIRWIPTIALIDATGKVRAVAKDLSGSRLETFAGHVETALAEAVAAGASGADDG